MTNSATAHAPTMDAYDGAAPHLSYVDDPSMQSLLAAVAHAPHLDAAPWTPASATLVGQRFGHFEVCELLGAGGMGRVYRTHDHRLLRDVALKLLPPEAMHHPGRRDRMLREAQAAARINHPNVAAIYDVGSDGQAPFIVMELVEGDTLRALLEAGPLPASDVVSVAQQIADGVAAAHRQGIVHRDLKPDNIMLSGGLVKILDFGLARGSELDGVAPAFAHPQQTQAGQVVGTPAYMSPEQARGATVDVRSDIFSFGTVLLEMLTGRCPFLRQTSAATRDAVAAVALDPSWDEHVSLAWRSVLQRCLVADPALRFPHAGELADGIRVATAA